MPSFSDAAVAPTPDAQGGNLEPRRVRTVAIKPPEPGSPTIEPVEPLPQPKPAAPRAAAQLPPPSQAATPAPAPAVTSSTPRPPPQTVVEAAEAPLPPKPKVQGSIGAAREAAKQPQKPAARGNDDVTASTGAGPPSDNAASGSRTAPASRPPQRGGSGRTINRLPQRRSQPRRTARPAAARWFSFHRKGARRARKPSFTGCSRAFPNSVPMRLAFRKRRFAAPCAIASASEPCPARLRARCARA